MNFEKIKQHRSQKRTFYLLEQLILKHDAHADVLKIKDNEEGLHFYFKSKSHAQRLIDFIQVNSLSTNRSELISLDCLPIESKAYEATNPPE